MQDILEQADQDGQTSIAIPAIGTGNLGFPPDVTAQVMYEEALSFSQQNPDGPLNDIRFVIYQQDYPTIKVSPTCSTLFQSNFFATRLTK